MNDDSPRDARLTETAQAIHADNLHLLARLDADDCNPGIELDCTLNAAPPASPPPASPPPAATKSDLRAAVKTILRGEDVNAAKPGPRLTPAKRRQIEAAEAWRKSHAGCSLHNACIRSFVPAKGGYKSADALYSHMHEGEKLGIPPANS